MAEYEISNPSTNTLSLRAGPGVIYDRIGSLEPGRSGSGDFLYTYPSQLVTDGQTRAFVDDQWVHVTEMNGTVVDGWLAVRHLGQPAASVTSLPPRNLLVTFGVELEGYNPITLTGTLTPK